MLLLLHLLVSSCETLKGTGRMPPMPRYVVVSFAREQAEIVAQGATSQASFQRLFLDRYDLEGERHHPGKDSVVRGVLVASHESSVVTVPIWTWTGGDGAARFLCQASDDGRPPALSAFATSEADLLSELNRQLRP